MSYETQRNNSISRLYEEHYNYLVSKCHRIVGGYSQVLQSQIEDVVQEAFLTAIVEYETFKDHPNQVGWLVQVCRNRLGNMKYTHRTRDRKHGFSIDAPTSPQVADARDELRRDLALNEVTDLVAQIEEVLSDTEREIFRAYILEDQSMQEVAETTSRSVSSIKSYIYRIRIKLKQHFPK